MEALKRANDIRVRRASTEEETSRTDGFKSRESSSTRPSMSRPRRSSTCSWRCRSSGRVQGRPAAQPVPDQPVEDSRWASPSASAPSSIGLSSTGRPLPVFVVTGPSGAGKGTLIKRPRRASARARGRGLRDDTAAAPAPSRTDVSTGSLSEEEFVDRIDEGAFLEHVELRRRPLRNAGVGARSGSPPKAGSASSSSRPTAP